MKITIKAKGKASENNEEELQKQQQLEELHRIEVEKELAAKEKQAQIDSLLEHFEKEAADSPELIKDKDSYFNSKEFDELSNESFDFNKKRRAELEDRVVHLEDVYDQEKKKSKNTIPWRNYIVYLMIITSLSCCMTFSKYITTVNGGGSGTVARFDVSVGLWNDDDTKAPFNETSNAFNLEFKKSKEEQKYSLYVTNNSDVTINARFVITGAENHGFEISTDGTNKIPEKTVQITAGNTQKVYLHFYGATKTITDNNVKLTITTEQVD